MHWHLSLTRERRVGEHEFMSLKLVVSGGARVFGFGASFCGCLLMRSAKTERLPNQSIDRMLWL
jgi:hypothetical protein